MNMGTTGILNSFVTVLAIFKPMRLRVALGKSDNSAYVFIEVQEKVKLLLRLTTKSDM